MTVSYEVFRTDSYLKLCSHLFISVDDHDPIWESMTLSGLYLFFEKPIRHIEKKFKHVIRLSYDRQSMSYIIDVLDENDNQMFKYFHSSENGLYYDCLGLVDLMLMIYRTLYYRSPQGQVEYAMSC